MARGWGGTVIAGLVVMGALFLLLLTQRVLEPVDAGVDAPVFALPRLEADRESSSLSLAALRGRVVLLNFWATWCAPCEAEMPSMERLYAALGGHDFELVAISVDSDRADVEAFERRFELSFPILLDPDMTVAIGYQVDRFPESILIDRDGRVVARYVGPRDWDAPEYVDRIRRLIEEGPDDPGR